MEPTYYASQRSELHQFLPERFDRLLDVGCSEGGYGAVVRARHQGCEVWGVEPHTPAAEIASTRLHHVLNDTFRDGLALPDGYFDVLTFNDSLEHMPDEHAALQLAYRKLAPGGTLICSVPNVRYLENLRQLLVEADWHYVDSGVLDRTHLRFFTRKSICRAVQRCGFEIQRVEGINSHWWSGWKVRLLRLLFGARMADTRWQQFVVVAIRK
jgi:2-polyprenyl-3-methyl-5-hydroxy-6-metoxy-1,4-benzoquinol methylase